MDRRQNFIRQLVQQRLDQIMNGGGQRRPTNDYGMEAKNNRIRGQGREGIGQQAISSVLSGNPNVGRLSGEVGTGQVKTRGNGRGYASAEPGTVSIGNVSSDTPPTITINGQLYRPAGDGMSDAKLAGGVTPPEPSLGRTPPRQTGVYNPPPPTDQRVGSTSAPPPRQTTPPVQVGEGVPRQAGGGSPSSVIPLEKPMYGFQGAAPTTNPKGVASSPPTDGSGNNLGNRIADVVRRAVGLGAEQPTTPMGIRELVNQRLMDRGLIPDEPGNPWSQQPVPTPSKLPPLQPSFNVVEGGQLPVIQGGERLTPVVETPGTSQTGTAPETAGGGTATGTVGTTPATAPAPTTGVAGVTPAPATPAGPGTGVGSPTGIIDPATSGLQLGNAQGVSWDTLNQWDPLINQYATQYGVDPAIIKAAIAMESGGQANPDQSNAPNSTGLLQIEPRWHAESAASLGYDLNTPEGQIGYFAALISGNVPGQDLRGNTPLERYINNYQGPEAGQTDPAYTAAYQHDVEVLIGMIKGSPSAPATGPNGLPLIETPTELPGSAVSGVDPKTGKPVQGPSTTETIPGGERNPQITQVITPEKTPSMKQTNSGVLQGDGMGIYAGQNADESWVGTMIPDGSGYVSTDYKQNVCTYNAACCCGAADSSGGSCSDGCWYNSSVNLLSGASNQVHPGYDIGAVQGTEFATPIAGKVLCTSGSGGNAGAEGGVNECTWAADYGIVMDGGKDAEGNQIYINYDHVGESYVEGAVGQYVEAGTKLGKVGGENHIHVEIHGYCPQTGKMVVLDPSLVYSGFYQTHSVCEGVI